MGTFRPHKGKQTEFLKSQYDWIFYGGARGGGKAESVDSLVYTPYGEKRMGDIKVGDRVCTPDGRNADVIAIHPQGVKPVYKVKMQDGGECVVTGDHLWKYSIANHSWRKSKKEWKLNTTDYLIELIKKGKNIMLPVTEPVQFTKSYKYNMRPLDPYLLGLLLGDGCITSEQASYVTEDDELHDWIIENCDKVNVSKRSDGVFVFRFGKNSDTVKALRKLKLIGLNSHTKYIPEYYLYTNKLDRMQLLRGLMDTDGYISADGKAYYTSVSKSLAENVRFLVKSLGGRCTISSSPCGYKTVDGGYKETGIAYELYIRMRDNSEIFNLQRKKDRGGLNNGGNGNLKNKIVSIEPYGEDECQCITLDSVEGLYLTDDFIVTHNSFTLAWKAALTPRTWHYERNGQIITEEEYYSNLKKKRKSEAVIDKISIDYPEYVALLVRRTFPQLERNFKPECDKLYKMYGAVWQERNHSYIFPSGAKVYLVHCKDEKALDNYIGGNYNFLGIDEVNQFPERWVEALATSVRSNNKEIKPQICLTSNPGNVGHAWLKRKFVEKCPPQPMEKVYNKEFDVWYQPTKTAPPYRDEERISYQYIPATVFDNPTLLKNDKKYVRELKRLNPTLRAMWLEGRWDVFAGMYFDKWNILHHIVSSSEYGFGTSNNNSSNCAYYRFYDYGTKNPFVCLFAAIDRNGDMVIYDEIVETGLAASRQAQFVNEYTYKKYKMKPADFEDEIADPAYWIKHSEKNGATYSPSMFYADEGIYLNKGNNDRKAGAKIVYDALDVPDEGYPRIRFTENCQYCIDTIPNLPASELDPEDIDTRSEDHSYDALRYGATNLLASIVTPEQRMKGWRAKLSEESESGGSQGSWMGA